MSFPSNPRNNIWTDGRDSKEGQNMVDKVGGRSQADVAGARPRRICRGKKRPKIGVRVDDEDAGGK
jgi:hypothetical protein